MGQLVDGIWRKENVPRRASDGSFVRPQSRFRGWVSADGSSGHPAEAGRYRLYVSLACPWAHRTLIMRKLKRLEAAIDVVVVEPLMLEDGWTLSGPDEYGHRFLRDVYRTSDPLATARVTVPVLWDKALRRIVNNESSEIVRMLNGAFDAFGDATRDYYPMPLRAEIDAWNQRIYETVNNGVYRCGFASSQAAYESAFDELFATLDALDARYAESRWLCGRRLTEADLRLFPTMVRFDAVYHGHFKCNLRRLVDYPRLFAAMREIHQLPGVAETVDFDHIKRHYYGSHAAINPTGIVPKGPAVDFAAPHDRARLPGAPGN